MGREMGKCESMQVSEQRRGSVCVCNAVVGEQLGVR